MLPQNCQKAMSAIGGDKKEDVGGCAAQISIKFCILAAENGARGNMEVSLGDVYILYTSHAAPLPMPTNRSIQVSLASHLSRACSFPCASPIYWSCARIEHARATDYKSIRRRTKIGGANFPVGGLDDSNPPIHHKASKPGSLELLRD
jgi:hypothetical protein